MSGALPGSGKHDKINGCRAPFRIDQGEPHPAPQHSRPLPLARPGQRRGPLPGQLCLRRRTPRRRNRPQALSAALRRISPHLGLRPLPGQPRRLRRHVPPERNAGRHRRRRPRLCLRPLPQRLIRLASNHTRQLTRSTTSAGPAWRPGGTVASARLRRETPYGCGPWTSRSRSKRPSHCWC